MADDLVLVDSSVWLEAIHPQGLAACKALVREALLEARVATCEVILAEVLKGARTEEAFAQLTDGMGAVHRLSMEGVGEAAGRLSLALRGKGVTLPTTDLLIAATAWVHGVTLAHRDQHLAVAAEELGLDVVVP